MPTPLAANVAPGTSADISADSAADTATKGACRNCSADFAGALPRFCPECGQETLVKPPTLLEFAQQFGGAYFSTEGAMWRTLKLLITRPGELTRQYLDGRRKHYVLPLRLYLSVSVVLILAMRLVAAVQPSTGLMNGDGIDPKKTPIEFSIGPVKAEIRDGQLRCEALPSWVCRRLDDHVNVDAATLQRELERYGQRFIANIGIAMFAVLPMLALSLRMLFANRRMRYTEHLVVALHLQTFWFIAMALTLPDWGLLTLLAMVAIPVHTWLATKRVYGGRTGPRVARLAVLSTAYPLFVGFAMLGIAIWTFFGLG